MEIFVEEKLASEIINISRAFGVDARVIGRVESSSQKKVTVKSEFGEFIYS
jgi:phosphoribosylformylglycinamidine cyclo-ligase